MPKRTWKADEKRVVAAKNAWKCALCENVLNAAFEIDHILPLEEGGSNDLHTNAQALCSLCHSIKTQRERILRMRKARETLDALQKNDTENGDDTRPKRAEDVILDPCNPFAKYCFLPATRE